MRGVSFQLTDRRRSTGRRLLAYSIGGAAKTVMMVCCSPDDYNTVESLSSLGFAQRCKNVRNLVAASPAQAAAQVGALKQELARLKKANAARGRAPEKFKSISMNH